MDKNRLNYAWAAGFFDGEGSIEIEECKKRLGKHRSPVWVLRVRIGNTHRQSLLRVQRLLGGSIHPLKRYYSHYKQGWTWCAASKQAEIALNLILPFLVVKRKEALVALAAMRLRRSLPRVHFGHGGPPSLSSKAQKMLHAARMRLQALKRAA